MPCLSAHIRAGRNGTTLSLPPSQYSTFVFSIGSVNNYQYNGRKSALANLLDHVVVDAMHKAAVRSNAPKCWDGTRIAVQRDIFRWFDGEGGEGIPKQVLWVSGPAGAGKSAIAGSLAERWQEEGLLAASFFFSVLTGPPICRSKKRLIPTLAYQLAIGDGVGDLKEAILLEIENDPSIFQQGVEYQLEALILRPLRSIRRLSLTPKVILIDGFDECEAVVTDQPSPKASYSSTDKEQAKKEVLSALLKLDAERDPTGTSPFRIVIFSRPEAVIQGIFDRNTTSTRQIRLEDERYNADGDITRFVRGKLAEIRRRLKLKANWPAEQDEVINTIVRKASGQFIYAAVAMNYLEQPGNGEHPQKKLKRILGVDESAKHDPHRRPFEQLDALYRCILYTSPSPKDAVKWIFAILELHSEGSDNLIIVKAFLESEPGEMEYLLGNLSSLLSITDTLRIFHKSLLDYLGSERCKSECAELYVDSTTTTSFLQERWYKVLKNRGPQVELDSAECGRFLQHYVESLTTRYFLPLTDKDRGSYNPADIDWWSDVCSEQLRPCDNRVERVLHIVHETCHWIRCRPHCKIWRTSLRRVRLGYAGWVIPNGFYFVTLLLYPLKGYT